MKDLREKTIRGGFARLVAQGLNFSLRLGSLMILARLLEPKDFGLVGMVIAFTGVLNLLRDFGLGAAAVQHTTVTEQQISNLFWINISVGVLFALMCVAISPVIAGFYHDPRLIAVTAVLGTSFLFNAGGVQHAAILQRQLRFTALAVINTVSFIVAAAIAIGGATKGYGYWALVAMTIALPLAMTIGYWLAVRWVPGLPRKRAGIRSMLRFGGTITLNGLVGYFVFNLDKILLGRVWGAAALGIYGRSYQLINIPTHDLNLAAGEVGFSALSRLQDDPARLRAYFLKGYSLVLTLTIPATLACALFANDAVHVLLGPKWSAAAPILRLLAPMSFILGLITPLGWLICSIGLVGRALKIALAMAPLIITGYVIGLPYGPEGVAMAYSAVMVLWVIPHIAWCVHGTAVSLWDVLLTASKPLASALVGGALAFGVRAAWGYLLSPFPRLMLESTVLLVTFLVVLLFVAGQKSMYLDLLRVLRRRSSVEEESLASA